MNIAVNHESLKNVGDAGSELLLEAAGLISTHSDPSVLIVEMLRLLSERMDLHLGRVILPDLLTQQLHVKYAYGLTPAQKSRGIYAQGEGVTGRVMATGRIAIVKDPAAEQDFLARIIHHSDIRQQGRSYIAVPVIYDKAPIGVLAVHGRPHHGATSAELNVLLIMAAMIGQILYISSLLDERIARLGNHHQALDLSEVNNSLYGIIGESTALRTAVMKAQLVSNTDATVMLMGESGTGKEKFAHMIHQSSQRATGPFVCINCAAIPAQLLESELFGHEKGSFTGAIAAKKGKFELANDGTLFLDEIGDMSLDLQAKLLRVLQEPVVQRVGGMTDIPVDVRIIAATHQNLQQSVNDGKFRLDLFYRLNVMPIQLPPLRERGSDIVDLACYFLGRANERYKRNAVFGVGVAERLSVFPWPGNIRQLENVIERAVVLSAQDIISVAEIDAILQYEAAITMQSETPPHNPNNKDWSLAKLRPYVRVSHHDSESIINALREAKGNKTRAAGILGLTPRQLRYRVSKLAITDLNPR